MFLWQPCGWYYFFICCFSKFWTPWTVVSLNLFQNVKFSLTVLLFLSTKPWVRGVLGAPCTCFIPCFWQNSCISLFLNSLLLSVCSVWGNPKLQNNASIISPTLLQLFCCVKHITTSTSCGGQLCVGPIDGFFFTWTFEISKVYKINFYVWQKRFSMYWVCHCSFLVVCNALLLGMKCT